MFEWLTENSRFSCSLLKKFSHLSINEFFEMVYLVMNRLVRLLDLLISLNFSTRKTFFHKSQKCFLGARKLNMWNTNYRSKRHQADHVRFFFVRLSGIFNWNISKIETCPSYWLLWRQSMNESVFYIIWIENTDLFSKWNYVLYRNPDEIFGYIH